MGSLLYQNIIPKRFLDNTLSRKGYWYKQLRLVYVYALTWEVSNCYHKLKYGDIWAKHIGLWIQVYRTWPKWECHMVVHLSV